MPRIPARTKRIRTPGRQPAHRGAAAGSGSVARPAQPQVILPAPAQPGPDFEQALNPSVRS